MTLSQGQDKKAKTEGLKPVIILKRDGKIRGFPRFGLVFIHLVLIMFQNYVMETQFQLLRTTVLNKLSAGYFINYADFILLHWKRSYLQNSFCRRTRLFKESLSCPYLGKSSLFLLTISIPRTLLYPRTIQSSPRLNWKKHLVIMFFQFSRKIRISDRNVIFITRVWPSKVSLRKVLALWQIYSRYVPLCLYQYLC